MKKLSKILQSELDRAFGNKDDLHAIQLRKFLVADIRSEDMGIVPYIKSVMKHFEKSHPMYIKAKKLLNDLK